MPVPDGLRNLTPPAREAVRRLTARAGRAAAGPPAAGRGVPGEDGGMDTERFLAAAGELLAVQSTADRPADLHRALGFVLDFVGPGFTVERFESGGKPSALIYRGRGRQRFQVILNAHLDVVPARRPSSGRAAKVIACTR